MKKPPTSLAARIKPPALRAADTVGIVAPGSAIQRDQLEAGCATLRRMGYKPFYFQSIFERDLYFAGPVKRRARELEEMFRREEVRAIICARGGYGCNYLLQELDLQKIAAHPKIFCGYSDATTLLTWFADAANLISFHGPMVAKDFAANIVDAHSWSAATGGSSRWQIDAASAGAKTLVSGEAEGVLYGGCLSMLAASLGTPYEIKTAGAILFLEDTAAKPFQIDRMLMQLKLAGKFSGVQAIIFGEMLNCVQHPEQQYTLEEVVLRVVGDLGIPVAFGLRSGHVSRGNVTLPIGVAASLSANNDEVQLKSLEAATVAPPAKAGVKSAT